MYEILLSVANLRRLTADSADFFLISKTKPGLTELVNQRLTPLQEKIESVMESTDILLNNVNSIFDKQTKVNIKQSIIQFKNTISAFETTSNSLNNLLQNNETVITSTLENFNLIL